MHAQNTMPAATACMSQGLCRRTSCQTIHNPINGTSDRIEGFISAPKPHNAPHPIHSGSLRRSARRIAHSTSAVTTNIVILVSHSHFTAQYMAYGKSDQVHAHHFASFHPN